MDFSLHQHIMVSGSGGRSPSEADDTFLFQRLISLKIYLINIMARGQRDEVPLELTTLSYFRD